MPRSPILVPALALLLVACGGGGGGGGSTEGDSVGAATGSPPSVDLTGPAGDVTTPTTTVGADGSDPDGDSLGWSWSIGDPSATKAVLIENGDTASATFTFPKNGTYTLVATADDGNGNRTSQSVTVVVDNPAPFTIDGSVSDDGSATTGLTCSLYFDPVGESVPVEEQSTEGDGGFSFDQLIGDKDQFTVLVPGS